ncbi:cp2 transcription factor [Grosmannia clavigera kw1407]|uniref:Cp2 transcription factor n=1 Tax=Grosmannia clavigera (strain kw1407 / UAMH 11150) TaxID=655863 RepID=F0XEI3_GROCL|nr:cp2 transcription factor [Grosmannia clavigera kw1407]EFX04440.1 cp2 transcription factor [Grosmannia clavigera kw1407]
MANTIISTPMEQDSHRISQHINHPVFSDQDPTPRASGNEPWRFTPLLDNGTFSFSSFPQNVSSFYPPVNGGHSNVYGPQADGLHSSALGLTMGMNAPLSMPASEVPLPHGTTSAAMMDIGPAGYSNNGLHPQAFHTFTQPFNQQTPTQPTFAPTNFMHHDSYEPMDHDATMDASQAVAYNDGNVGLLSVPQGHPQVPTQYTAPNPNAIGNMALMSLPAAAEKFRFQTTLNAPTAMIKHSDEIPISYLNKGQAYSLSIIDTEPELPIIPGTKFRTFVRISFEDEQQRRKPGVCWSLWKEGRGTNEAHQRGGKLQAVEYVEAALPPEGDEKRTRVELESASFDGFSVVWTPGIHGHVECNIAVRFNFLSTDFSHSKGVKGIPVRLCAKTTRYPLPPITSQTASPKDTSPSGAEICFCKVKLFRDHGAERKLSNDVAHIKKTIDKLKQQIAQAENGMKDFSKRKRPGGATAAITAQQNKPIPDLQRVGKVPKHKRTWSMSSTSSGGDINGNSGNGSATNSNSGGNSMRLAVEEDLHCKLQTLQDMFTSTRPVSILFLKGDELDDPDLHPVSLPGEPTDLTKIESRDSLLAWREQSGRGSATGSSMVSPSPSSLSLHSQLSMNGGTNVTSNGHWSDYPEDVNQIPLSRQGSDQLARISKTDSSGNLSGWIETLGVDPNYRPPPSSDRARPVACLYVLRRNGQSSANGHTNLHPSGGSNSQREYHRAIYLMQRTLSEFVSRIVSKWKLDPSKETRTVRVLPQGLEVELDDETVAELPEGQDMVLDVVELPLSILHQHGPSIKGEWDMAVDGKVGTNGPNTGYEFRLSF